MKVIMLIDMDAYFASVEQSSNPALRGKPIAVTGSDKRTVVTTSSYEARARGVKTGMNVYEAKKVCHELIIVVGNNRKYTYTCAELANLYRKYTPDVEVYSVDESFLDLTTTHHLFGGPMAIGREIKKAIGERFGLAFVIARKTINYNQWKQTPLIDDNGNGIGGEKTDGDMASGNFIGFGVKHATDMPVIGSVAADEKLNGKTSTTITANNVTTSGSIQHVWAVIKPPDFKSASADEPVINLPAVDLKRMFLIKK